MHLKVADLERALGFYRDVLGFAVTQQMGRQAAFLSAGIPLDGASDYGMSEALYLHDPDDNGVELYWDRPREAWPRAPDGELAMFTKALDLDSLLAAGDADADS